MKHNASLKKPSCFDPEKCLGVKFWVDKEISHENYMFQLQNKALKFFCNWIFLKVAGLWLDLDWIVNPFWKVDLDLDWQSHISDGFGLDWQSKKIGLSNSLDIAIC